MGSGGSSGSAGSGGATSTGGTTSSGSGGTGGTGGASDAGAAGSSGLDSGSGGSGSDDADAGTLPDGPTSTPNLFTELLGVTEDEVEAKVTLAVNRVFAIGTGEPNFPTAEGEYRLYYELPQDPSMAFIWAADSNDIRSEGMSYGMMIAVQRDMQSQFDKLWKFSQTFMQYPANDSLIAWRHYFRWQGFVDTSNRTQWAINYGATTGPAPDGEEYFAAALYLAHLRWGSDGAVDYLAEADALANAMLNNPSVSGRTPVFDATENMVVFYPHGTSATFSDPSYHLPAFYELFAREGPSSDRERWLQIAEISRQYLVDSAHASTGLHPDYANFDGTPNAGGDRHDEFRYDAWRVVMNMGVDYAWFSSDARMQAQTEKYHAFFSTRLTTSNVTDSLFALDGSNPSGQGSTALTATLAAGALASAHADRRKYVENLWNVGQQAGFYRYYQELVYVLGLLATSGRYAHRF